MDHITRRHPFGRAMGERYVVHGLQPSSYLMLPAAAGVSKRNVSAFFRFGRMVHLCWSEPVRPGRAIAARAAATLTCSGCVPAAAPRRPWVAVWPRPGARAPLGPSANAPTVSSPRRSKGYAVSPPPPTVHLGQPHNYAGMGGGSTARGRPGSRAPTGSSDCTSARWRITVPDPGAAVPDPLHCAQTALAGQPPAGRVPNLAGQCN